MKKYLIVKNNAESIVLLMDLNYNDAILVEEGGNIIGLVAKTASSRQILFVAGSTSIICSCLGDLISHYPQYKFYKIEP